MARAKKTSSPEPSVEQPVILPKEDTFEIGVRGEFLVSSYNSEEFRVDDLTIKDYRRMKDNDGEIQMLLNAIYNSILSAGFTIMDDIEYDPESSDNLRDTDSVSSPEKDFIEANLTNPLWKKGMSRSIGLTNKTNLRAFEEGYRVSELIYRVDDDGMIRLDRLAPRAARVTDYEMKIITDDFGNFYGFHQISYFRSGTVDVVVVNESEIMKTINVVFGEEYGSNYGRSGIRSLWYHYDKAHKAMYLNHVGHELGAIKFRKLVRKSMTSESKNQAMLDALDRISQNQTIMYNEGDFDLIFESVSDAAVMQVGKEMIEYHTSQMSKALLAQFVDLGMKSSGSGSRALGDSGKEFFRSGLQYLAKILIEEPWNKIIADLIKMNFNRGVYPCYRVNEIDETSVNLLYDSFIQLVTQGKISDSVNQGIQGKAAERLGIEVAEEQIEEEMNQQAQQEQETKKAQADAMANNLNNNQKPDNKANANIEDGSKKTNLADMPMDMMNKTPIPNRELFLDEKKVKMIAMSSKMDDMKLRAEMLLKAKLESQKATVISTLIKAARSGSKAVSKAEITLAEQDTLYSDELDSLAMEMFEYGKVLSSNELNKPVPVTSALARSKFLAAIANIVTEQSTRLSLRLKTVVNNAINNNLPENNLSDQLSQEYDSFFDSVVDPTVEAVIPQSLNQGRQLTFDKYQDQIFAYRYTAAMEPNVCPYCRALDGKTFQETDPNYAMLTPPNHFGCRCIWTPITNDENSTMDVYVSGKPNELPTYSSLSSFKGMQFTEIKPKVYDFSEDEKEVMAILDRINKSHDLIVEDTKQKETNELLKITQ